MEDLTCHIKTKIDGSRIAVESHNSGIITKKDDTLD